MSKHQFFQKAAELGLALAYDDVRLKTGYTEISPSETRTGGRFSRNISLNIPLVSSPMDTVTESKMAIAMAKAGGIGVLHRNMDPQTQASQVNKVKLHLNIVINKPITVTPDQQIAEVDKMREDNDFSFHSFPVVDEKHRLIGLLTKHDFDLCEDRRQPVKQAMTAKEDLLTTSPETSTDQAYELMRKHKKKILPLIDNQGVLKAVYIFSDIKKIKQDDQKNHNIDQDGHLKMAAAIGTGADEVERGLLLAEKKVDALVIDTAHGDSKKVMDTLKTLKNKISKNIDIVAGNVSEGASARRLAEAGADGIRVGQGPGSICTTRVIAGIGSPQLSAVYHCAEAVKEFDIPVCADGGINNSGDITIALAAGAESVMLGRLLAGTNESPGDFVTIQGAPYKTYRGMGSVGAMNTNRASRERYGQTATGKTELVPEGVEGAVPYKGAINNIIHQHLEGVRRGMGYVGAADLEQLRSKAEFHRISQAGWQESHPHHIQITQDAPNYSPDK